MFTQSQAAQVKQLVIKHYGKFVTEEQLAAIYRLDHAQYSELVQQGDLTDSYSEYFGDLIEDEMNAFCFRDCVVDQVLAA